ncbi:hypothetical protein BC939DRAFT_441468 [Gamsiella multidivaricata]|uniref:uncharacterized protein n=1 Tax=Gamsiella multidivaricata TaxID=101098 RepID=UPI00221F3B43|nr:uncharacterized protein BC939DRAFT_441468 [Gamsiella multidivaricata]KAG0362707.1 hypothetical protein BGZ54_008522 [Gamsiella multidivaricata]KAI7829681.1 hypothetical protein BC939DRAFT_441468 [Gamsiella multidivaricata]
MVRSFTFTAVVATAALFLLSTSTTEAAPLRRATYGQTAALVSASEYCLFLPPLQGGDIAENEDRAVAFCNVPIASAPNAGILPTGFIKTLNFVENTSEQWVQITGQMDGSTYDLSSKDEGGQYDMRAPVGAICADYNAFVQITEPDQGIYCLRCCKNKKDCPVNKSEDGCEQVLGGVY